MKEKQEWGSSGEEKQKIRLKRRWSMRRSTKVKTEGRAESIRSGK